MDTMFLKNAEPALTLLASRWWTLVVRGVAALLFGIATLFVPGVSLTALVLIWGGYAIVDGAFNLMLAMNRGRSGERWGWFLLEGILSVAAGVLTFLWPAITAVVLLVVIATWAVLTGVMEIATAAWMRRVIRNDWLLALSGVLSVVFGVLLFARPAAGALAVAWLIGCYAIAFGALLLALGVRLYRLGHPHDRAIPTGGTPTPA